MSCSVHDLVRLERRGIATAGIGTIPFADAGWSKADVRNAIYEQVRRPARELRHGETTPLVQTADPETLIPKWDDPERIAIVVAGGEAGRFSAVCGPSLGMGANTITREVQWTT